MPSRDITTGFLYGIAAAGITLAMLSMNRRQDKNIDATTEAINNSKFEIPAELMAGTVIKSVAVNLLNAQNINTLANINLDYSDFSFSYS